MARNTERERESERDSSIPRAVGGDGVVACSGLGGLVLASLFPEINVRSSSFSSDRLFVSADAGSKLTPSATSTTSSLVLLLPSASLLLFCSTEGIS